MRELQDDEQDFDSTEITLGTGKLLGLFLGLVIVCGIFFSLGYALGKNNASAPQPQMTENGLTLPAGTQAAAKPGAGAAAPPVAAECPEGTTCPDASAPLAPSSGTGTDLRTAQVTSPAAAAAEAVPQSSPIGSSAPEMTHAAAALSSGIVVQVAAVSKREDAEMLMNALRGKNYPVFLANNGAGADHLFHVQVGPFSDAKDAEATRNRLSADGYSPIVKR